MIQSKLLRQLEEKNLSPPKVVQLFYKELNSNPDAIKEYGDGQIPVTVSQNKAAIATMRDKGCAVSITFNNWLKHWLRRRHGKIELKKLHPSRSRAHNIHAHNKRNKRKD